MLAWDIKQDTITDAGPSTEAKDPIRMMFQENTWDGLLEASPYRVTYVTFSPIIKGEADPRRITSSLRSIAKTQANIVDYQILQDVKPVPEELDVQSEKGDYGLIFCTFPALRRTNSDVGLCKRLSRHVRDGVMEGRFTALTVYTTEEIKKMSKCQI